MVRAQTHSTDTRGMIFYTQMKLEPYKKSSPMLFGLITKKQEAKKMVPTIKANQEKAEENVLKIKRKEAKIILWNITTGVPIGKNNSIKPKHISWRNVQVYL